MPMHTRLRIQDADMIATIKKCCDEKVTAMISLPETHEASTVQFLSFTQETIIFNVIDVNETVFKRMAMCIATYLAKDIVCMFISPVCRYTDPGEDKPPQLVLEMPANLGVADLRRAVRIPVAKESELDCLINVDQYSTERPLVLDISMSGMLVSFYSDSDIDLAVGDLVHVKLTYEETKSVHMAEVCHRTGQNYGMMFTEGDAAIDTVEQEEYLEEIVDILHKINELSFLGNIPL